MGIRKPCPPPGQVIYEGQNPKSLSQITIKKIKSYNVQIWCGLREQYTDNVYLIEEIEKICQKYCSDVNFCVSLTPTKYIYTNGYENGVVIGLISYPRFPRKEKEILSHAFSLGKIILKELSQHRITITTPDKSYMLESPDLSQ